MRILFLPVVIGSVLVSACSQPNKENAASQPEVVQTKEASSEVMTTERSTKDTKVMFVTSDETKGTHFNEVDSVSYSGNTVICYGRLGNKEADVNHGVMSRELIVSVNSLMRKNYNSAHAPVIYKAKAVAEGTDGADGVDGDELTITENDKDYQCDSIYDYGNKLVGYYNSNQTITLDNYEKDVEVRIYVELDKAPPKPTAASSSNKATKTTGAADL